MSDHVSKGINNCHSVHSILSSLDLQAELIIAYIKLYILPFEFGTLFCGLFSGSHRQLSDSRGILICIPGPTEHKHKTKVRQDKTKRIYMRNPGTKVRKGICRTERNVLKEFQYQKCFSLFLL